MNKAKLAALLLTLLILAGLLSACRAQADPSSSRGEPSAGQEDGEVPPLPEAGALTDFSYLRSFGDQGNVSYSLTMVESSYFFSIQAEGINRELELEGMEVPADAAAGLAALLDAHNIAAWNGFSQSIPAADGAGFSLSFGVESGLHIEAEGYEAWPEGFQEADQALRAYLEELAKTLNPAPVLLRDDQILSTTYEYGSFHGGCRECSLVREGEQVLLSAQGWNGVELEISDQPVPGGTLEAMQALLVDQGIIYWNGFSGCDKDVPDGYSFVPAVDYQGDKTLRASGYMVWPNNDGQAHDALSGFLLDLAEPYNQAASADAG